MSDVYIPSVSLHQQGGGMSVQAFADREGLSLEQAKRFAKRGQILGARQDARSKYWWIYPPAKLLVQPRSRNRRSAPGTVAAGCAGRQASAASPGLLPRGSAVAGEAGAESGQPGYSALQGKAEGNRPPASCGRPAVYIEARGVCQVLHEAVARQFREGLHYLRLDAHEFAQLYAALSNDRRRVRKLIGKKLLPVGLLRASDSVWQKMQCEFRFKLDTHSTANWTSVPEQTGH